MYALLPLLEWWQNGAYAYDCPAKPEYGRHSQ
jgi:hypothetical protein